MTFPEGRLLLALCLASSFDVCSFLTPSSCHTWPAGSSVCVLSVIYWRLSLSQDVSNLIAEPGTLFTERCPFAVSFAISTAPLSLSKKEADVLLLLNKVRTL